MALASGPLNGLASLQVNGDGSKLHYLVSSRAAVSEVGRPVASIGPPAPLPYGLVAVQRLSGPAHCGRTVQNALEPWHENNQELEAKKGAHECK